MPPTGAFSWFGGVRVWMGMASWCGISGAGQAFSFLACPYASSIRCGTMVKLESTLHFLDSGVRFNYTELGYTYNVLILKEVYERRVN